MFSYSFLYHAKDSLGFYVESTQTSRETENQIVVIKTVSFFRVPCGSSDFEKIANRVLYR